MRRRLLKVKTIGVLALLLMLFMTVGAAEEETTDVSGQWTYVLEDGGATITGYVVAPSGDLMIPSELDGYPVTGIGDDAFTNCFGLTGVTIPDSVVRIGVFSFASCNITSVTIPDSVTDIGSGAFYECSSLTSVIIPDSVTRIGRGAFNGCKGLTSVNIPASVTSIGELAFAYSGLTGVTIPASVTEIGSNPFIACPMDYIDVAADNPVYEQVDGVLFDKQQKMLVAYPNAKDGTYAMPEGVLRIGENAFLDCGGLVGVIIPDSVTSIGDYAFVRCVSLTSVTIPNSMTDIGADAFSICTNLTSIVIPEGVASIGGYAFDRCEALTSLTIPPSVVSIGAQAFRDCENLVLFVAEGSYAEEYAKENDIPHVYTTK